MQVLVSTESNAFFSVANHDTTLTTDNFTFMRRAIGMEEGEVVRHASAARGKPPLHSTPRSRELTPKPRENKRTPKHMDIDDIHDDNDGQYDKPEVVIERDSDDFVNQIMASEFGNSLSKSPKIKKEENSTSTSSEKVEMIHPSMEKVIVSPLRKKSLKPTARKSTTQKFFKQ